VRQTNEGPQGLGSIQPGGVLGFNFGRRLASAAQRVGDALANARLQLQRAHQVLAVDGVVDDRHRLDVLVVQRVLDQREAADAVDRRLAPPCTFRLVVVISTPLM
jgi:hypothetical protein